jgi:hypothetical protein
VTDGAASDGGTDGAALATQSELLASEGVDVYTIGVGSRVYMYVADIFSFTFARII